MNDDSTSTCSSSSSSSRSWAHLPGDILFEISRRVDSRWHFDVRREFCLVCTSWRSALRIPPTRQLKFPIGVPYFDCKNRVNINNDRRNFSIKESTYYYICPKASSSDDDSEQGWLIRVREVKPRTWRLLNPNRDTEGLFDCNPPVRAEINLLDYRIQELTRSYTLADVHGTKLAHNVVVLSMPKEDDVDLTAIIAAVVEGELMFWKTGESEWWNWSKKIKIAQIALYKDKLYALESNNGNVYVIDPSTIAKTYTIDEDMSGYVTVAAPPQLPNGDRTTFYLDVPRNLEGRLYYIVHRSQRPFRPDYNCSVSMFVLDEEHHRWDSVTSFKNQAFLLLQEASFAIPTRDLYRDSSGGWIFFVNASGSCGGKRLEGLDSFSYPLHRGYYCVRESHEPDEPDGPLSEPLLSKMIPFSDLSDESSSFFPPPPWIKWHCPSRGNNIVLVVGLKPRRGNSAPKPAAASVKSRRSLTSRGPNVQFLTRLFG